MPQKTLNSGQRPRRFLTFIRVDGAAVCCCSFWKGNGDGWVGSLIASAAHPHEEMAGFRSPLRNRDKPTTVT